MERILRSDPGSEQGNKNQNEDNASPDEGKSVIKEAAEINSKHQRYLTLGSTQA